ncbi:hypothetical protein [Bifidobacterium sp. SO1]|uniref:hypothetical protein n=1 Tax=Bifidobacterium sp. SO1 TaxID=2809029 RepID=UPI001BDD79CF|nr:hypothetical protein [Bifidobacterium sp. SO1]MBT1162741.1 hypothetical protein [Bifidobacterium sp. SO1]
MIVDTYQGEVDMRKPIPAIMTPWLGAELEDELGRDETFRIMDRLMEANGIGEHDEAIRVAETEADMFGDWTVLAYDPDWEIREIRGNRYGVCDNRPYTGILEPVR